MELLFGQSSVKKHELVGLRIVQGQVLHLHLWPLLLLQVLQEDDAAVAESSNLNVMLTILISNIDRRVLLVALFQTGILGNMR